MSRCREEGSGDTENFMKADFSADWSRAREAIFPIGLIF